jgi:hypothetical protein
MKCAAPLVLQEDAVVDVTPETLAELPPDVLDWIGKMKR